MRSSTTRYSQTGQTGRAVADKHGYAVYRADGALAVWNEDLAYVAQTYRTASTRGFYIRNCITSAPATGTFTVTTYSDDDETTHVRIQVNQASPTAVDPLPVDATPGYAFPRSTGTVSPPLSTDATLSGLSLSGVDIGTFDSATTDYTASVGNDVTETTVTANAADGEAGYVVKLDGATDDDGVIPLAVGSNVIAIEVTAEDGQATQTYTVTVTRSAPPISNDAALSSLSLSGVDIGTFDSATTDYTASVGNDVAKTTVTPTTNDDGATHVIKLDGATDGDGVIPLPLEATSSP